MFIFILKYNIKNLEFEVMDIDLDMLLMILGGMIVYKYLWMVILVFCAFVLRQNWSLVGFVTVCLAKGWSGGTFWRRGDALTEVLACSNEAVPLQQTSLLMVENLNFGN